jgi:hypothetical protein
MQKPSPTITPRPTLEIVPATPGALAPHKSISRPPLWAQGSGVSDADPVGSGG